MLLLSLELVVRLSHGHASKAETEVVGCTLSKADDQTLASLSKSPLSRWADGVAANGR
jgi:hypothetical protein